MLAIIQLDARVPAGLAGTLAAEAGLAIDLLTPFSDPLLPEPSNYSGIIILGGYMGVGDIREYPYLFEVKLFMKKAVLQEIPLLGICLGGQLLAEVLEAPVRAVNMASVRCRSATWGRLILCWPVWEKNFFPSAGTTIHLMSQPVRLLWPQRNNARDRRFAMVVPTGCSFTLKSRLKLSQSGATKGMILTIF